MRIGIVGSDNSHAIAYSKIANVEQRFGDNRVTVITGDVPARTEEVAKEGDIPAIVAGPAEMIGEIDAAIVVNRHGDLHAAGAIPLLEAGIPVYVDKPFAISLKDCERMVKAASEGNTWVTSFSSLRFAAQTVELDHLLPQLGEIRAAQLSGPCDFESEYAGAFFYATHVLDIMLRLLGNDVATVAARRSGQNVTVTITYANDALVTITYTNDTSYHFTATLFGKHGYAHREIIAGMDAYAEALGQLIQGVESDTPPLDQSALDLPIRIVHAITESLENGGAVTELKSQTTATR